MNYEILYVKIQQDNGTLGVMKTNLENECAIELDRSVKNFIYQVERNKQMTVITQKEYKRITTTNQL